MTSGNGDLEAPARAAVRDGDALPTLLTGAIGRLKELGEPFGDVRERLGELSARLSEGQFHLAVLGQFKRGKSTLLNALLGEAILPTAVVPLTAIPTFIRFAGERRVHVLFEHERQPAELRAAGAEEARQFLAAFVTERGNPGNRLEVSQAEVFHPAAILDKGVVLIDTPGIGSTFRHNTEATLNFLPRCDAALFLVSPDPPMTEAEIVFLKEVRAQVPRLFFLINKVDYLDPDERAEVFAFVREVLQTQAGLTGETPIFQVSARSGLEARHSGDRLLWSESGLAAVERHLVDFLANEKAAALRDAVAGKAADALAEAVMRLGLAVRSLKMPIDDLERRLAVFEEKLKEVEAERVAAGDLLSGDHKRMQAVLEEHAERLRTEARGDLLRIAERAGEDEGAVSAALEDAVPGYFERRLGMLSREFDRRVQEVLGSHQARADRVIEQVRATAAELFEVPYHAPESAGAFEIVRQPYWVTHQWTFSLSPLPEGAADRLLPAGLRRKRREKRLAAEIDALVVRNVENLRWATLQSINETFVHFTGSLDSRLAATIAATHGAIRAALAKRRERSEAAADEVARLQAAAGDLERVQAALESN